MKQADILAAGKKIFAKRFARLTDILTVLNTEI